ncbi:MAG: hypothetical protein JNN30_19095 [Rhodanobacteraceae bacterium]|nr:hypothetical protein [Rhodanobacteraceae bacterium]
MFVRYCLGFLVLLLTAVVNVAAQTVQNPDPFAIAPASGASPSSTLDAADVAALSAALDRMQLQSRPTPESTRRFAQARADLARVSTLTGAAAAALSRSVVDQLNVLAAEVSPLGAAPEVFGVRSEQTLGTPECPKADMAAARCNPGEWLSTDARQFHTIKKRVYLRGSSENTTTTNVSASFVADADNTNVAIVFTAEAYMHDGAEPGEQRMFVRALLDGVPAQPGDVVFATTAGRSPRSFVFTANVDAGIHTVEMQWHVDQGSVGYLRDAALLIRTGSDGTSAQGSLVVKTPASGAQVTTTDAFWKNVPDMSDWIYVPPGAVLTATISAESYASNGKRIALRAFVDNALLLPADVVFAKGATPQSRMATFAASSVSSGWHKVTFQWLGENGGTAVFGDRSLALAAYPSSSARPRFPAVVAPSGPSVVTPSDGGLVAIPHMKANIHVPAKGNGEVAVQFSAEIGTQGGAQAGVVFAVDGKVKQFVTFSDGLDGAQLRSWVFEAKQLNAGMHELELFWYGGAGAGFGAYMGDRIMAVLSETGFIPDLAEAPRFGGGHIGVDSDHIGGIEALVGKRNVLAILWDPHSCDAGGTLPPECYDQTTVPKGKVESALYGLPQGGGGGVAMFEPNNVRSYFHSNSNDRFTMVNAGVLGWYNASEAPDYYQNHPGECVDGFEEASLAAFKDAVLQADAHFNYAAYDIDSNGRLDNSELAIVVIIPRPSTAGSQIVELIDNDCDGGGRVQADNVWLPQHIAKVNINLDENTAPNQFSVIAHELMHLLGGLDDLYFNTDTAVYPRDNSLMANNPGGSSHLDPMYKLALGWVTPKLITRSGDLSVADIKLGDTVYIMPRYNNPYEEEYFIIENRQKNLGAGFFDAEIDDEGIAVWHVVSDRTQNIKAPVGVTTDTWEDLHFTSSPAGSKGQMGRNGIRLIRPFQAMTPDGTAIFANAAAKDNVFWDNNEWSLLSNTCAIGPTTLTWSDCTASGYSLDFHSPSSNDMSITATVE